MPSSTSNFEDLRSVPVQPWPKILLGACAITFLAIGVWEWRVRQMGYPPVPVDNADLWARTRAQVDADPSRPVIVGDSRSLYDLDLDVMAQSLGDRPIQLSTVGTNCNPYLQDLANHPEFNGLVIVGFSPGLFYAPGGPPMDSPKANIQRFRKWTPAQKASHAIALKIQHVLAFLEPDLTLQKGLEALRIPNRKKAQMPPRTPPTFFEVTAERQCWFSPRVLARQELVEDIQQIWIPLFTPPPPPPHLSEEEFGKMMAENGKAVVDGVVENVNKIRARGGDVIFVRFPSTGTVRDMENQFTPREQTWEPLIQATQCIGIHFEDHQELSGFDCPEWSHLVREDATEFTKRLMQILEPQIK